VDLKKEGGIEVAKRLVKDCDAAVDGFRPKVMKGSD
jgi:crotonobetainyl-CoA:carnitine CoA-transferase CaiB-like acyl-CoA transferase